MQLVQIDLRNWGPFFEEQSIPLEVDRSAPIVIFNGENMRGKTSLLRAINYALYGAMKAQDGRTNLPVSKMVNLDAIATGEAQFGVALKFSHDGSEFTLDRSGTAVLTGDSKARVTHEAVTLIPRDGLPYPAANIPEVIESILSRNVSEFFLFDGEMLSRFEERLRDEDRSTQGFVRSQVEKALGLPFMQDLATDLEGLQASITTGMNQALKRAKKHAELSDKYNAKIDELDSAEKDLVQLRSKKEELTSSVGEYDQQLAKVAEIKELYYERKSVLTEVEASKDAQKDLRDSIADLAEENWWLPSAGLLASEFLAAEDEVRTAEAADRESFRLTYQVDQLREQMESGVCPACQQPVVRTNLAEIEAEIESLSRRLSDLGPVELDTARVRRDKLRPFASGEALLQRLHEQEQDLRRERMRNDRRHQRLRDISESISGNAVDIETVERNLQDARTMLVRVNGMVSAVDTKRSALRAEVKSLGSQIADQPGVDELDRKLQQLCEEAIETVEKSYDLFRSSMRARVSEATSALFRQLTTEKDYQGVAISDDYMLSVVDQDSRSLDLISAGANQILTMAFIGALGDCAVEEAPLVMDTPFGRLDTGHRNAILRWIATLDKQVILFVQSGEYDPRRDASALATRIGREFVINRLSPTRSEVVSI